MLINETTDFPGRVDPQDIAIIGISCRFPKADNKDLFWDNLLNARECISFLNEDEIEVDRYLIPNKAYVPVSGIIEDYDGFDAKLFNIPERTAKLMTPEHRAFVESAWDVMVDAGYDSFSYSGDVAVYSACNTQSIGTYSPPPNWINASDSILEESQSWLPDALAPYTLYHLGLTGEAMSLGALCAGFHSAVHYACQSLLLGQVEMAIAGGVMIRLPHIRGHLWEKDKPLSMDGHSRPFDKDATGGSLASGVATLLLKPLKEAMEDKDHIYAVIKGTSINNNGAKSMGFGIFHMERLSACIASSIAISGVDPETITMTEAVGASLPISDVVEFNATKMAYNTRKKNYSALGAVKGNLGHAGVAAGGASSIKAILSIKNGVIPKSINFSSPNPDLDFDNSPFYMQTETADWKDTVGIRRACVNAIGGGGYNANLILEEPPRQPPRKRFDGRPVFVPISAHTYEALIQQLKNLDDFLDKNPLTRLDDVGYTLHLGRKEQEYRWATVVTNVPELKEFLKEGVSGKDIVCVKEKPPQFNKDFFIQKGESLVLRINQDYRDKNVVAQISKAWLQGHKIARDELYSASDLYRTPLPAYPFQRKRYWKRGT